MKTGANTGLQIYREADAPGTTAELLHACSALLGFFALWLPLACLFRPAELESLLPAAGVGTALCLALAGFRCLGWERYAAPGALLCLAAFTAAFLPKMTDGACLSWNAWCDARTAATGTLHLGRTVALAAQEHAACAMLFSLAGAWALALLCDALASRWRTGMVLLSAALTALVLLGLAPEQLSAAAGMGALCAALLQTLSLQGRSGGKAAPPALAAAGLAAAVAAAAAVCAAIPALRSGEAFLALRGSVLERIHISRYESGDDGLPEGELAALAGKTRNGKAMLTVSMDQAEPLYLRGFTGARFTGTGWESLSNETLAENASLLYWLHMGGFYPQTQTGSAAAAAGGAEETNRVTVTNLAACSRYVYAPYSAAAGSFASELPLLRLAESSVLTRSGSGRTAVFSTVFQAPTKTGDWVQRLDGADDPQKQSYLALESGYRRFVQENYLAIPEETRQLLASELDALAAARGGSMDEYLAVQCVQAFLEKHIRYSEEGKPLPAQENFVSYTLETGVGCDFHYATLGVLALRYYGVPARYAEGYIVTEQLAPDVRSAAQNEYDAALASFAGASDGNAQRLADGITKAVEDYRDAQQGEGFRVCFTDGADVAYTPENYPGVGITAVNAFGRTFTDDDGDGVLHLVAGDYTFSVVQDYRRIDGSMTVSGERTVSAVLPSGDWMAENARISLSSGERFEEAELTVQYGDHTMRVTVPDDYAAGSYYLLAYYNTAVFSTTPKLYAYYTKTDGTVISPETKSACL